MPRRFHIRPPASEPVKAAESTGAFDWSEAELDALSEVSRQDMDDTRDWLRRLGQDEAAALFEAEKE
jgi:hypothetical protein